MHPLVGERAKAMMERQGRGDTRARSTDGGGRAQHGVQGKVWADRLLGPDLGSTVPCVCLTPLCLGFLFCRQDKSNAEQWGTQ